MTDLNCTNRKYAYLEQLSTEKLEEILKMSSNFSDGEDTSEYFDAVEEVLLKRETMSSTGRLSDLDTSWKEFQQQYKAPEGKGIELYPADELVQGREQTVLSSHSAHVQHQKRGLLKKVTLIAAIIIVLSATMVVAQAAGLDVWGMFAHWTEETFQFQGSTAEVQDEHRDYYKRIQAETEKCGIEEDIVPTWYPEGYILESVDYSESRKRSAISALFIEDGTSDFLINYWIYSGSEQVSSRIFEKDSQEIETYTSNEKTFYLVKNLDSQFAVWANDSICVEISGTLSNEELKMIIDSIGG